MIYFNKTAAKNKIYKFLNKNLKYNSSQEINKFNNIRFTLSLTNINNVFITHTYPEEKNNIF